LFWDSTRKGSALAHRLSYEAHTGKKLHRKVGLDHTCQTEACVRPDHLRETTQKQNSENLKKSRKNNISGARGVYWDKVLGKWRAVVCHDGRKFSAGAHTTVEAAEAAVIVKRNELFTHNDLDRV
jgi:hypothetical protein